MGADAMSAWLPTLSWLDWTMLAVVAASVLVGLVRGFVFEVLSLAGWVFAWFVAQWAAPEVAPWLSWLPQGTQGGTVSLVAAFVLVFVLALLAWVLVARLIRLLIRATPLSLPDRALGAGFGALRALVLLLALAVVVLLTPASQSSAWRGSQGAAWLTQALQGLRPLLPEAVSRHLPRAPRT